MTDPHLHQPGPAEPFPMETRLGAIERPAPIYTRGPVPPWSATVTITPLKIRGHEHVQFDIIASWTGPPLPGTPTPRPGQKVQASDSYLADTIELARAIADRAYNQLHTGHVPDLRALAGELRNHPK